MKCTNCGNEEFFTASLEGPTDEGWWNCYDFYPMVCAKCGHVEFFASKELLEKHNKEVEHSKEIAIRKAELQNQLDLLLEEKNKLDSIINNDNNSVKEVKNAKEKVQVVNSKIKEFQYKIKFIR